MDNIVKNFATDLVRHRRYNYSQEALDQFLTVNPQIKSYNFRIPNHQGNLLDTLLLKRSSSTTCILYAHGLGSNKLESLSIAKYFLKQKYDVCAFDFSGSGRSQGNYISYGINQKEDVLSVLRHLQASEDYNRIILWGRSMGAVAVVLSQELQQNSKVDCIILDSPFCSFEKIAIEIASKRSFVPQFMIEVVIEPLKQYFKKNSQINPFTVDLEKAMRKLNANLMLIYSQSDSVVSSSHSKSIVKYCRRNPVEVVIQEDHNMKRSKSTYQKTLNFIKDSGKQLERRVLLSKNKNRGISVASRDAKDKQSVKINSNSKIRVLQPSYSKMSARQPSTKPERHIRTVASMSINDSNSYSKRLETEQSPLRRRTGTICSVFFDKNRVIEERLANGANKENKPSLNMMRRLNRFR